MRLNKSKSPSNIKTVTGWKNTIQMKYNKKMGQLGVLKWAVMKSNKKIRLLLIKQVTMMILITQIMNLNKLKWFKLKLRKTKRPGIECRKCKRRRHSNVRNKIRKDSKVMRPRIIYCWMIVMFLIMITIITQCRVYY